MTHEQDNADALYLAAAHDYGAALQRLARAYEADAEARRDLLQDIHLALWRSMSRFAGRCSMRTWVYRVAHNVALARRLQQRRVQWISLDALEAGASFDDGFAPNAQRAHDDVLHDAEHDLVLARLRTVVRRLRPPDDQVMLLYLEDFDAAAIGEVTGLSARAVALRVHRAKRVLARLFGDNAASSGEHDP